MTSQTQQLASSIPSTTTTNTIATHLSQQAGGPSATSDKSVSSASRMESSKPANGHVPNGSVPNATGAHSRKGSIMVGGGVDIQRGNIAFGTANIDSPNPLLSSSPAVPFTTGTHLAGTVKSFGSIDADGPTDTDAVKATRRVSGLAPEPGSNVTSPPIKEPDLHSLFGSKPKPAAVPASATSGKTPPPPMQSPPIVNPIHGRRPSMNGGYPAHSSVPNAGNPMYPNPANQSHLRPPLGAPNQSRSPNGTHMLPGQYNSAMGQQMPQGFRPQSMQANGGQPVNRPHPYSTMQPGAQRPNMMVPQQMNGHGMHPGQNGYQMMGYPGQGYYEGYNVYSPQQFGINPQWAPQQHPQSQYNGAVSPLAPPHQLAGAAQPSPSPHPSNLPSSSGASPAPTPPSRPASLINHQASQSNVSLTSLPSTPSRSVIQGPGGLTPQSMQTQPGASYGGLSGGASSFTPRATKIRFARPDGTALDIKEAAAAVKGPVTSPAPAAVQPAEPAAKPAEPAAKVETHAEPIKKKVPSLPVMVRLESEDQKKARLAEEEQSARIRKEEEREAQERKDRKERFAREEEERAKKAAEPVPAPAPLEKKVTISEPVKELKPASVEQVEPTAATEPAQAESKPETPSESLLAQSKPFPAAPAEAVKPQDSLKPAPPSNPVSPLASPALASAGLPPKPVSTNTTRRPAPAALDISATSNEGASTSTSSILSAAKPIEDISSIVYPGATRSPRPDLNVDAKPGKYRYDREFLMQFMHVCREKPENLPPLDEIGLEADASSGFGSSRNGRNSRTSIGAGRGGPPTGLGIGIGGNRPPFPAQGMGSFTMGSFGSGSIRGTTSEERYNRSLASGGGRQGSMARTPSQGGGLHGLPPMSMSTSRSGTNRSQRGQKRQPQDSRGSLSMDPDVAPLVSSTNSWVKARPTGNDEGSPAYIERKVKALLNKLTAEKFDSISMQILEWANKSAEETDGMTLKLVIKQIFEKATDEAHWSSMYARLCRLLLERLDPTITQEIDDKPVSGGMLFRRYLVGRCQMDFETGWKAREDAATAAEAKSKEDKERLAEHEKSGTEEAAMLSDEYYIAQKAKRRGLGLVQLIGELYNLDMIGKGVIRQCFMKLLLNLDAPDEEDVESACKLLTTVGRPFEAASRENVEIVMDRLVVILNKDSVASRIKFMILDIIDLRKNRWESRNKAGGVMTIAEVHQAAAREQAEKTAAAAQSARESLSRGGSRAGHSRAQPGEWQSVASNARPLQRPTDFSNIGRNISSAGVPSAPTFGPTSVFAKGRGKTAGTTTPPLSRQASTANMFSALRDEPSEAATERRGSGDAADPQAQRPKLNLQPRTKPVEAEDEAEGESAEPDAPASGEDVEAKLNSDMKELWGEKDAGGSRNPDDIVEYLRSMSEEHRAMLAKRLVDDVFRIAKIKDAEIVADGWTRALEEGVATTEVLRKGLESRLPTLDDEAVDFPLAYPAMATLIQSLSLSPDEIEALAKMIDVDGTPRITPQQKLEKALAALSQ